MVRHIGMAHRAEIDGVVQSQPLEPVLRHHPTRLGVALAAPVEFVPRETKAVGTRRRLHRGDPLRHHLAPDAVAGYHRDPITLGHAIPPLPVHSLARIADRGTRFRPRPCLGGKDQCAKRPAIVRTVPISPTIAKISTTDCRQVGRWAISSRRSAIWRRTSANSVVISARRSANPVRWRANSVCAHARRSINSALVANSDNLAVRNPYISSIRGAKRFKIDLISLTSDSSRATRASRPDSCGGPRVSAIQCTAGTQRVRVFEGSVTISNTGRADDRTMDVCEGAFDGALDTMALGEAGRDRRGECATGAVGMTRRDPRALPDPDTAGGHQHVRHGFRREMSALDQRRSAAEREQRLAGGPHLADVPDRRAAQDLGFRQVRRDNLTPRDQQQLHRLDRARLQQPGTTLSHHHRVDDKRYRRSTLPQHRSYRLDYRCIVQHAGLDHVGANIVEHHLDLPADELWRYRQNSEDALGILRGKRGYRGCGIGIKHRHSLDVGLDAGAAPGIGTGDDQYPASHYSAAWEGVSR